MNKTILNKRIASLTNALVNAQFRAGVIERRLEYLDREAEYMQHDKRPRVVLLRTNNRRAADSLRAQLAEAFSTVTWAYLELQEARRELPNVPHEPVKSVRREAKRTGSGLYRMGRFANGRSLT